MIGEIRFDDGSKVALNDDGSIETTDQRLKTRLSDKLSRYKRNYSPSQGGFGVDFLYDLAKVLGGRVHIEKKEQAPSGTIY